MMFMQKNNTFWCSLLIILISCSRSFDSDINSNKLINPKLRHEILTFHHWDTSYTNKTNLIRLYIYNMRDTAIYSINHEIDATSQYKFNQTPLMIIPINNLKVLVYNVSVSEIGISKDAFKSFLKKYEPDNWEYFTKNHESYYAWKIAECSSWEIYFVNGKFVKREINDMWR